MGEIFEPKHALITTNQIIMYPHRSLPEPEAPKGVHVDTASLENNNILFSSEAVSKFFQERKNSFSKAISSLNDVVNIKKSAVFGGDGVTEFNVPGVRVVVRAMDDKGNDGFAPVDESGLGQLKGRVTFFSRSNCRDCGAVRKMLKEKGFKYVEINIDVYPTREKELIDRTGSSTVPQIYFNDKLIGGLVAMNSLRNSGLFEQTAKELLTSKCSDDAPYAPVYGYDDPDENQSDEMNRIVKLLRQKLPIQDRLVRLRIVKNCFSALDLVDVLIFHLGCSRDEAVDVGKEIARKHFIHHVSGGTRFEDGDEIYRFLEHQQFIPKCYNFRGCIYDKEPDSALRISQQLMKIMSAILESYASEDRHHVDYLAISNSEEFRRYLNLVQGLQRADLHSLSTDEKLAFFLNLYNAMVIHAVIRKGYPEGMLERKSFVSDFLYLVGGNPYSLNAIRNGILRCNRRAPYALVKPFNSGDDRLQMALPAVNSLIHFGLCDGAKSSPTVRFFTPQNVQSELRAAAREFFRGDALEVDLFKRTVYLTSIFKWYNADFGSEKEILKWIMNYLEANKAGLLTHLMSDGGIINIVYKNFDWSINS